MTRERSMRWLGEVVVIIVGVLVALGVDDWRQGVADRQLEAALLERLEEDLVADAGDLAFARVVLARRHWVYSAITEALSGVDPSTLLPPDSLVQPDWALVPMVAANRPEADGQGDWNPHRRPLQSSAVQFDISDDSFQEMIVSGALRALRDQELRVSILAYYRTAEDHATNVDSFDDQYYATLVDLLLNAGVSLQDPVDLAQLIELARENPRLAVQFRFAQNRAGFQAGFLRRIDRARLELEAVLARQGSD